jgi:hypothetical protein
MARGRSLRASVSRVADLEPIGRLGWPLLSKKGGYNRRGLPGFGRQIVHASRGGAPGAGQPAARGEGGARPGTSGGAEPLRPVAVGVRIRVRQRV